jgi:RNA polymerase sigma-70 factor (ECF subfamily)
MKRARRAGKDRELSRALSENVDGNFERLIREYQDRLYRFSLRLTGNRADAEEIVQEGFVRAYRALKTYPPGRIESMDLSPWVYRIVLNVFRNRVRKASPPFVPLHDADPGSLRAEPAMAGPNPEEMAGRAEIRKRLELAIARIPERYRTPLILRWMENVGYSRMTVILRQPEGTIKANVHRGLQMLKRNFSALNRGETT